MRASQRARIRSVFSAPLLLAQKGACCCLREVLLPASTVMGYDLHVRHGRAWLGQFHDVGRPTWHDRQQAKDGAERDKKTMQRMTENVRCAVDHRLVWPAGRATGQLAAREGDAGVKRRDDCTSCRWVAREGLPRKKYPMRPNFDFEEWIMPNS
jgi:hypothetical protein